MSRPILGLALPLAALAAAACAGPAPRRAGTTPAPVAAPADLRSGVLAGRVTAADGAPLPGVFVAVTRGGRWKTAVTDTDGQFDVAGLAPGQHHVELSYGIVRLGPLPVGITDRQTAHLDTALLGVASPQTPLPGRSFEEVLRQTAAPVGGCG